MIDPLSSKPNVDLYPFRQDPSGDSAGRQAAKKRQQTFDHRTKHDQQCDNESSDEETHTSPSDTLGTQIDVEV